MDGRGSAIGMSGGTTRGVGVAACVSAAIAFVGCGSTDRGDSAVIHAAGTHRSAASAYVNPEVAACMQTYGVTVLGDGSLRAPTTMTVTKRKAVEKRCGLGQAKVKRRSRKSIRATATKPPVPYQSSGSRRITKIVACLHRNGVSIPSTDTALLSSTSGIKTRSPRVKATIGRCRSQD